MPDAEVIPLTEKTARALQILREHNVTMARQFGRLYFGNDHPSWRKVGKCGHGSHRGVGLTIGAGGFLGRLRRRKLIDGYGAGMRFTLTALGERSLNAFEEVQRLTEKRA